MTPSELVLSKLPSARQAGNHQWTARCPAHDDQHASLSIGESEDGTALVRCHAGCDLGVICERIGIPMRDLFSCRPFGVKSAKPRNSAKKQGFPDKTTNRVQTYPTAEAAIAHLETMRGPCTRRWAYHNVHRVVVGWILRWDQPSGKVIRPVSLVAGRWIMGGMPTPRPLYRLPELTRAGRIYVCEGEKACDAAWTLGLVATCSAHGAQSAKQADWSPLAGKEVILLPDNDSAGRQYVATVADILATLQPTPALKCVELPGLPPKGDLYDFVVNCLNERGN